jgi:hypothetical protein
VSLDRIVDFYTNRVGMKIWLEQSGCTILRFGKMLLGFCERPTPETEGCITFVVETKAEVDDFHNKLRDVATSAPKENPEYRIYNFFATDPEGRTIEFQIFLHDMKLS